MTVTAVMVVKAVSPWPCIAQEGGGCACLAAGTAGALQRSTHASRYSMSAFGGIMSNDDLILLLTTLVWPPINDDLILLLTTLVWPPIIFKNAKISQILPLHLF